jgi:hypothetical protein
LWENPPALTLLSFSNKTCRLPGKAVGEEKGRDSKAKNFELLLAWGDRKWGAVYRGNEKWTTPPPSLQTIWKAGSSFRSPQAQGWGNRSNSGVWGVWRHHHHHLVEKGVSALDIITVKSPDIPDWGSKEKRSYWKPSWEIQHSRSCGNVSANLCPFVPSPPTH